MTQHFPLQSKLMTRALRIQQDIRVANNMFTGIDNNYLAQKTKELNAEYSQVITELMQHLCEVTGFTLIPAKTETKEVAHA